MSDITHTEPAPTLDEVWRLIRETDRQLREQSQQADLRAREADRRFQETERFLKEQAQEAERRAQERAQETDRRFQETERFLKERSREMDRYLKQISKETDKKIAKLGNRLGEFVEGLIKPSVVRVFQEWGIPVHKIYSDMSADDPELGLATQIDLFVVNKEVCALIEVKSKLSNDDVNEHVERMEKFKPLFPEYANKQAYGAVAAMVIPEDVAKYAYRKGFFVLAQQGDSIVILNSENFKPVAW
jgi:exonuclease VII large subunit